MSQKLNIFVDDERALPSEYERDSSWIIARNVASAKVLLEDFDGLVDILSLDHDMGEDQATGYDLITWVENRMHDGYLTGPKEFRIHSQNPVGIARIRMVIEKIENERI